MSTTPLVIWGASGHARVLQEFMGALGYRLIAIFDNDPEAGSPFAEVPLHRGERGFLDWRQRCSLTGIHGLAAIGGHRGADRRQIQQLFQAQGIHVPSVIHPRAFVAASARLGAGTQVLAQSAVCADVETGAACIINTRASVDHECQLADGVHIAPGAVLAGCVRVDENALVGVGAIVLPRIRIGARAIIGAGAVVTRDVDDGCIVYGNPARVTGHS